MLNKKKNQTPPAAQAVDPIQEEPLPEEQTPLEEHYDMSEEEEHAEEPIQTIQYANIVGELFDPVNAIKKEQIQNAVFEDKEVKEHIYKLKDGKEAISFFAKYGDTTPIKFICCRRKEGGSGPNKHTPYDLEIIHDYQDVIKEANRKGEYYTVSPSGIVHVQIQPNMKRTMKYKGVKELTEEQKKALAALEKRGKENTEYISLSEWMKESTQYNIVSNIHFFRNYLGTKIFKVWRNNVQYRKFCKKRLNIVKKVFYCKPAFAGRFMNINRSVQEIHDLRLIKFETLAQKKMPIDQFYAEQKTDLNSIEKDYARVIESLIQMVNETLTHVRENRLEKNSSELQQMNFNNQVKQKAIFLQKLEARENKLRRRLAKEDDESKGQFVRLVNYLCLENLIQSMNRCLATIEEEMCDKPRNGLFLTNTSFRTENSISYGLTDVDVVDEMKKIVVEVVEMLQGLPSVVSEAQLEVSNGDHMETGHVEHPRIEQIVRASVEMKVTEKRITNKTREDFQACQEQVNSRYLRCEEIERRRNDFKVEEWRENPNRSLDEIRSKIKTWRKYQERKDIHIRDYSKGIFQINSNKIKTEFDKYISKCLDGFIRYLYEYFHKKADFVNETYEHYNTSLNVKEIKTLKEYSDFIRDFTNAKQQSAQLAQEYENVTEALKMLTLNKYSPLNNETVKKQNMDELQVHFKAHIESSQEIIQRYTEEMQEKLKDQRVENSRRIQTLLKSVMEGPLTDSQTPVAEAVVMLNNSRNKIEAAELKGQTLDEYHKRMLEHSPSVDKELRELNEKFGEREKLWKNIKDYDDNYQVWFEGEFHRLDIKEMQAKVKKYDQDVAYAKTKIQLLTGDRKKNRDPVLDSFNVKLEQLKEVTPIAVNLKGEHIKETHWLKVFDELKGSSTNYLNSKTFTLKNLMDDGVKELRILIEDISIQAEGEASIKEMLASINAGWKETEFLVKKHRGEKDKYILDDTSEIFELLEDHQNKVQGMLGSKHVAEIRADVEIWEERLGLIQNTIEEWLETQRQWIYLENIFSSEDIKKDLPNETAKFETVNRFWRDKMMKTNKKPNVLEGCSPAEILERFQENNRILDEVQKLLEDFLDRKRGEFPRFYFLTDDELIEILSQTKNPHAVQEHLRKCFDNIKRIKFKDEEDSKDIIAMISAEPEAMPETVPFSKVVTATSQVEAWLSAIEEMMRISLYDLTKLCMEQYPEDPVNRQAWFFASPAQSVLVVDMIRWTFSVEEAIKQQGEGEKESLNKYLQIIVSQIQEMVKMVKTDLLISQRETIKCMIVLDVHNRDTVTRMIDSGVSSINEFEWSKQLRYYWDTEEADIFARQTNTNFRYGYEYLGNGSRLVITPLTDKCYITLTGALHLCYGGAPAGPAGTGKTETTKDLAKSMAVQCIVFNCGSSLDVKTMGRFFTGLAQCGAWACFDEFNRIEIEVLSVIAQQILTIQNGIREGKADLDFEGKFFPLNSRFGVFITMNPGYAGRTKLPDNLKALFRPVAMMIPDYALIAEIILFSEGFQIAKNLSRKMVYLYKLSSEQLSKQSHYDFGMRAVKSVLVMAGALRRKVPEEVEASESPEKIEGDVLLKAMRDSNKPKFLTQDLGLFDGIIRDLFPKKDVPPDAHVHVVDEMHAYLKEHRLQHTDGFQTKIIQLLETMVVRHGVMTVGNTGTGKSTITKILASVLTSLSKREDLEDPMFKEVRTYVLNPKAVTEEELFGYNDKVTDSFTHGIVSKLVTGALKLSTEIKQWVWFDGPVDAGWIENMNTVLDDNKMLCLPDGKRIKLPSSFSMIFEVQDLLVASPATVSRCGMVYLDSDQLGYMPVVHSWWENIQAKEQAIFDEEVAILKKSKKDVTGMVYSPSDALVATYKLLESVLSTKIEEMRTFGKEMIPSCNINLAQSCLNLFSVLYEEFKKEVVSKKEKSSKKRESDHETLLKNIFIFSFFWSVGGNLSDHSRKEFNQNMQTALVAEYELPPFSFEDFYGSYISLKSRKWETWERKKQVFEYRRDIPYSSLLVDTTETARYKFLLRTLNTSNHNVLLMGETGVGKSVIVKNYLKNLQSEGGFMSTANNFSAQTSSKNIKDLYSAKLGNRGKNLGPPSGKKMIFFFDDINMPKLDLYGAQPPNEFIRQVIDQGGFYDMKKYQFKKIMDCCIAAACSPPGGGKNPVSARLFRHFHMIWIPELNRSSMEEIFKKILRGHLEEEKPTLVKSAEKIVRASVDIYRQVIEKLLPTPEKSHYTFNLRDLSKVVQGVLTVYDGALNNTHDLVRAWLHEEQRVFHDRLVNMSDRDQFLDIALQALKNNLAIDFDKETARELIFTEILEGKGLYCEVTELEELIEKIPIYQDLHEKNNNEKLDLVFFKDAVKHLCRTTRVLSQPRGNCLLVGVGGSGRQSLSKIGTAFHDYHFRMIEIGKNYREPQWRENLAEFLMLAGSKEDKAVTFLFSDTQIIQESFLEDINNLLNTGEVPNLFKPEIIDIIVEDLREKAVSLGYNDTRASIMECFTAQVRENLHIVLTFSPVGSQLRDRCRQFPSIINCCTIDWFDRWPDEALRSVAMNQLQASEEKKLEPYFDRIADLSVSFHNETIEYSDRFYQELKRKYYITPTSYLELLKHYIKMYSTTAEILPFKIKKYEIGLEKLQDAKEKIGTLKESIIKFQPILKKKQEENVKFVAVLEKEKAIAAEKEVEIEAEAKIAKVQSDEVNKLKNECEEELNKAQPALLKAKQSASQIEKSHVAELKQLGNNAKQPIKDVIQAIGLIFGYKDDYADAKKVLTLTGLQGLLATKDPMDTPGKVWEKVNKEYLIKRFPDPEMLRKSNVACVFIADFLHNAYAYYINSKKVIPLQKNLATALEKQKKSDMELKTKLDSLAAMKAKVADLNQQYETSVAEEESLKNQEARDKKHLERANILVDGLGDESKRWEQIRIKLLKDETNLAGNIFVATGVLSYLGPFTSIYRKELIEKWVNRVKETNIPIDDDFDLKEILCDKLTIRRWQNTGLPADDLSTENGIIMSKASQWPLMIDPQSQANKWIKEMNKEDATFKIVKLSSPDFAKILENAVRFGNIVLIENIEENLDPLLEPILKKDFKKGARTKEIKFGDKLVPYDDKFRLYMTSKMQNPHYIPEIVTKVALINFTVTPAGLEDQLLIEVVKNERPALEKQRDDLIVQISDYNKELAEIQEAILQQIRMVKDLLDDEKLIQTLKASKTTSETINKGMKEAEQTSKIINKTREEYRPVAIRGSILYFVIANLSLIDPMYQYSLEFFINLFKIRLLNSEAEELVHKRIKILVNDITSAFYKNICRGLFEKDKLLFSFINAYEIFKHAKKIAEKEWIFFKVGSYGELQDEEDKPEYLTDALWSKIINLSKLSYKLTELPESLKDEKEAEIWKNLMDSDDPQNIKLPERLQDSITNFQKLLVYYTVSPEKLIFFVQDFVRSALGQEFIESPPFDLAASFNDSTCYTPIIFILSSGADPMANLLNFAKDQEMDGGRFKSLSLGRGQGQKAINLINSGWLNGDWVCLQNCHLAESFMPALEQIQERQKQNQEVEPKFRLWLTSTPSKKFPVSVLQNGIKITNEPPRGIRANVTRTYLETEEKWYNSCVKTDEFQKLYCALSIFHAVILERRKFGAIGWNKPYEWMNSDLDTCQQQLFMYLEEQPVVPFDTLRYLIAVINYGGRVTDDKDEILIGAILKNYITDSALTTGYTFSESGTYKIPDDLSLGPVREYIKDLPLDDKPEVFGLHDNANITFQINTVKNFVNTLIMVQPGTSSGGKKGESTSE